MKSSVNGKARKLLRWNAGEWDAYRRGFESGKVIGRQDGLAEKLPRRTGPLLTLREVMKLTTLSRHDLPARTCGPVPEAEEAHRQQGRLVRARGARLARESAARAMNDAMRS